MGFEGFPDEALVFYERLEADNSKTYWTAHKHLYEEAVRAPLQALADELAGEFGAASLFRPYRDVRFDKDKSPYKTHQGAYVRVGGEGMGYRIVRSAPAFRPGVKRTLPRSGARKAGSPPGDPASPRLRPVGSAARCTGAGR
ncbi:DUF2461 family protein [Thermopolyspora sp. NPDC052614]|uniref:DUF2461 family protein n=1 Tax=Thermopolyspora sp. NPDC052614 TaxID=3155682 RepID=UPI00341B684E